MRVLKTILLIPIVVVAVPIFLVVGIVYMFVATAWHTADRPIFR